MIVYYISDFLQYYIALRKLVGWFPLDTKSYVKSVQEYCMELFVGGNHLKAIMLHKIVVNESKFLWCFQVEREICWQILVEPEVFFTETGDSLNEGEKNPYPVFFCF